MPVISVKLLTPKFALPFRRYRCHNQGSQDGSTIRSSEGPPQSHVCSEPNRIWPGLLSSTKDMGCILYHYAGLPAFAFDGQRRHLSPHTETSQHHSRRTLVDLSLFFGGCIATAFALRAISVFIISTLGLAVLPLRYVLTGPAVLP